MNMITVAMNIIIVIIIIYYYHIVYVTVLIYIFYIAVQNVPLYNCYYFQSTAENVGTIHKEKKVVTKKEMLDTVDITPEHLEEIFLCFTGQGSQKLSLC